MYAIFFPTAMRNMANADSGNQSDQVRILVADDHEVMRLGIRNLLESVPNWTVIDEAGTGREAVDLALQSSPDNHYGHYHARDEWLRSCLRDCATTAVDSSDHVLTASFTGNRSPL